MAAVSAHFAGKPKTGKMRKALLIGIDHYKEPIPSLRGCVNDAQKMKHVLARHYDESPNFSVRLITSAEETITRASLRQEMQSFFKNRAELLLFFFAGHGYENQLGGSLVTQDAQRYDEGILMSELIAWAAEALEQYKVGEVVLILDCCHSGHLGNAALGEVNAKLPEGLSILTSSTAAQASAEKGGGGLFTSILSEALNGGACNLLGDVTVADMYSFADQLLGPWQQRPTFKTHISSLTSLRKCKPRLESWVIRLMENYFPDPHYLYPLDPSYEPTHEPEHKEHEEIFSYLQAYRASGLLEPIGEEHMYFAAIHSKHCALTPLGRFYWKLVKSKKI